MYDLSENVKQSETLGFVTLHPDVVVDSMWGNFLQADDGYLYVAAGNHETFNGDVWLFQVDPETKTSKIVMSLGETLGTRAASTAVGESKVHTRLYQNKDGLIFMGTMQGGIGHVSKWNHYSHPSQYEGGHLFCYNPKTNEGYDLGIPVKYEGLQTQVLDKERNILYFVTWPKKLFVSYNINTRETKVHGVLSWSPTRPDGKRLYLGRDIMISKEGIVYSTNNLGYLTKFDPDKGELEDTRIKVMEGDSLRAHVRTSSGMLYFVTSLGYLFSLDPYTEKVIELGSVLPDRAGYTPNLALTHDESKLVYLASSHASYTGHAIPLVEFDIATRAYQILGEVDADFFPVSCFGAVVDRKGQYVFAIHGQEPSNSFLAFHDKNKPQETRWLLAQGTKSVPVFEMEKKGSEGNTKGWIVADYQLLSQGSGLDIRNDQSAITSLALGGDGRVYGATSAVPGKTAYLFAAEAGQPYVDTIAAFGKELPAAQKVYHSLVSGGDGSLYGGTIDLLEDPYAEPRCTRMYPPTLKQDYEGGFLFSFNPGERKLSQLGIPVPGQGIYAMCASPDGSKIYALTYPHAYLICLDVASQKTAILTQLYDEYTNGLRPDEFDLAAVPIVSGIEYRKRTEELKRRRGLPADAELDYYTISKKFYVSRAITCDQGGHVYGSHGEGYLFKYDVSRGTLNILESQIPIVSGTNYGLIAEPSIESLIRTQSGILYGGTSQDGYLFSFDPATQIIRNLGKPGIESRIRALAEWRGGVYGIIGEALGKARLFRYEEETGLSDLGVLQGGGKTGFAVNECDALLVGADDRLYIGQSERISCLLSIDQFQYEPHQSP